MPISTRYLEKLLPNSSFHIYNRTNNKEDLFKEDINRFHFLQNLNFYLKDYLDIHVYCLLGNHFHLLVTTKSIFEVREHLKAVPNSKLLNVHKSFLGTEDVHELELLFSKVVINQFRRFFLSYTLGINKMYNRSGNLFNRPFKRIAVNNRVYFLKLVLYIHKNPIKHGINESYTKYCWSSYQSYLGAKELIPLKKTKVNDLFNTKRNFIERHQDLEEYEDILEFLLEK